MKLFYGWRIVIAGGALQFLQSLLLVQAFGVYVAALVEERGWSKTSLAAAAGLKAVESAVFGPVLGWMVDRFGAARMVRAGILIFGVGFMLLSQTDTLMGFYAAFVIVALGASMCSNFVMSVSIIQWFERHRTRALSALQFGGAVGGLFVFLIALSVQTLGWRWTAFGSGVLAIVLGWPLARVIRSRPEDLGETIDGLPPAPKAAAGTVEPAGPRMFTPREALRTQAFWLISIGHAFALLIVMAVNVHTIIHLKEGLGYSLSQATLIFTLVTVGQACGVALGWAIGERFVKRKVAASCMLMHALGLLMLTYSSSTVFLCFSVLIHGIAWGLRGPFMQAIRADYFGRRSIGTIMGLSAMITVFGHVLGPIIAGAFADWTGNYRLGFTVLSGLAVVGSLFFMMARRPR